MGTRCHLRFPLRYRHLLAGLGLLFLVLLIITWVASYGHNRIIGVAYSSYSAGASLKSGSISFGMSDSSYQESVAKPRYRLISRPDTDFDPFELRSPVLIHWDRKDFSVHLDLWLIVLIHTALLAVFAYRNDELAQLSADDFASDKAPRYLSKLP